MIPIAQHLIPAVRRLGSIRRRSAVTLGVLVTLSLPVYASTAAADSSLYEFTPSQFNSYVNTPTVQGNLLVFQTTNPPGPSNYSIGVGATGMPDVETAGSTLEWALLACSSTATTAPTYLNIGVQSGKGDENNLSVVNQLAVTTHYSWVTSQAVTVTSPKPAAFFYIPGPTGQQMFVRDLILGDPASVSAYIAANHAEDGGTGSCAPSAGAASTTTGLPLYQDDVALCGSGGLPSPTTEGFVNFQVKSGHVHVDVHIENAVPNAPYNVVLESADCSEVDTLGVITTNSNGVGNGEYVQASDATSFILEIETDSRADYAFTPVSNP